MATLRCVRQWACQIPESFGFSDLRIWALWQQPKHVKNFCTQSLASAENGQWRRYIGALSNVFESVNISCRTKLGTVCQNGCDDRFLCATTPNHPDGASRTRRASPLGALASAHGVSHLRRFGPEDDAAASRRRTACRQQVGGHDGPGPGMDDGHDGYERGSRAVAEELQAVRARMFKNADADTDGKLTIEELRNCHSGRRPRSGRLGDGGDGATVEAFWPPGVLPLRALANSRRRMARLDLADPGEQLCELGARGRRP